MFGIIASSRITAGSWPLDPKAVEHLDPVRRGDDFVALHLRPRCIISRIVSESSAMSRASSGRPSSLDSGWLSGDGRPSVRGGTKRKVAPRPGSEWPRSTAVEVDQGLRDRQSEAGAADALRDTTSPRQKRSKTWSSFVAQLPGRCRDGEFDRGPRRGARPPASRAFRAVLVRVGQQVDEYLADSIRSASTSGRSFSTLTVSRWFFPRSLASHRPPPIRWASGRTDGRLRLDRSLPASLRARSSRSLIIF